MLLDDIISLLEDEEVGEEDVDLFPKDWPPNHNVPVLKVVATGGPGNPDSGISDKRRPTFMIQARGVAWGYQDAEALLESAFQALHDQRNVWVNGTYYTMIEHTTEATDLGYDQGNRPMLSQNYMATREG